MRLRINICLICLIVLMCASLSGCAGLDVTYQLHAVYKSKELIAKEREAVLQEEGK